MQYLHTMLRVSDLESALDFYCGGLGLVETRRYESEKGRFTLVFLAAPNDVERAKADQAPLIHARIYRRKALQFCARRAMVGWPLSEVRTARQSSFCKMAITFRRRSHGCLWKIRASGKLRHLILAPY